MRNVGWRLLTKRKRASNAGADAAAQLVTFFDKATNDYPSAAYDARRSSTRLSAIWLHSHSRAHHLATYDETRRWSSPQSRSATAYYSAPPLLLLLLLLLPANNRFPPWGNRRSTPVDRQEKRQDGRTDEGSACPSVSTCTPRRRLIACRRKVVALRFVTVWKPSAPEIGQSVISSASCSLSQLLQMTMTL